MKAVLFMVEDHDAEPWLRALKTMASVEAVIVDVRRFTEAKALAEWQESNLNPCKKEPTP